MKSYLIFLPVLMIAITSCNKKHKVAEEKTGDFFGQQTTPYFAFDSLNPVYTDSVNFYYPVFEADSVIDETYSLEYDRETKSYFLWGHNGAYGVTFAREDFQNGHLYLDDASTGMGFSGTDQYGLPGITFSPSGGIHQIDLVDNKLTIHYEPVYGFVDFVGYLVQ